MFRRRSASADTDSKTTESASPEASEATQPKGYTPKKGVPTPKRKESESSPRKLVKAPETRKEAYQIHRARLERQRGVSKVSSGGLKGVPADEARYYRPADLGPARRYARDLVDSRRTLSEFFLPLSIVIILLIMVPSPLFQVGVAYVAWPLMMVSLVIEGILTSRRVKREAAEHYPEDDMLRGIGWYAVMRQIQFRRLRLPKPKLKVGQAPVPH